MVTWTLGVDVGGTFTDFFAIEQATGRCWIYKVPSTPDNPANAIMDGLATLLAQSGQAPTTIDRLGHGTTVATNTLLQGSGPKVSLITTEGFRDLLEIGRQVRPHMYDLQRDVPRPLVPRDRRIEIAERVMSDGTVLISPAVEDIDAAATEVTDDETEACAVCFLFSFINPVNEQQVRDRLLALAPHLYVSLSSEVHPEFREYERLSTTVLNAYLQPIMARYIDSLEAQLKRVLPTTLVDINQSSGGLMSVDQARRFPVRTALSGPAAGVVGAIHVAHRVGRLNIITLDMGGTSTDISLVRDGKAVLTFDRSVAEFPVRLSMLDINTIGAGGGSILWFDVDGLLKVGPQSAGADPGPACYGKGGQEPTVSDANLVLGRLPRRGLLHGRMPLDEGAARYAFEPFANPLGYSVERTAHGVIEIAVSNMVRAIRAISVERGHDPRDFSLMTFGGAGPLHATDVARSLGIREIIVPAAPGILCAQGLLASDLKEDFVATVRTPLADGCEAVLQGVFQNLDAKASEWFDHERVAAPKRYLSAALDMRYIGQNFELQIDLGPYEAGEPIVPPPVDRLRRLFLVAHEMHYGYCTEDDPVEIITYRLTARGQLRREEDLAGPPSSGGSVEPLERRRVYWSPDQGEDTPVYDRSAFGAGTRLVGPAVIEQLDATTLLFHGDSLRVDDDLNLIIELQ